MSAQQSEVVHYFDTVGHRIACGVPGFGRSTKHARAVNCPSCIEQLRHGPAASHAAAATEAVHAH